MNDLGDPVALARELIRCRSVTPDQAGALDLVQSWLTDLGFACRRLQYGAVDNLYGRLGNGPANLLFLGHVDVVPPGDASAWSVDPFAAKVQDEVLIGRGAVDMKGGIAAWIAALAQAGRPERGTLSILLTSDEEGPGLDGTRRALPQLIDSGEQFSCCLVGEPTSETYLADCIKIGRRGSLNCTVRATGVQGHVAYPEKAANPITALIAFLSDTAGHIDNGSDSFQPSNIEITSVDAANDTVNLIPRAASARLNARFAPLHDCARIETMLREKAQEYSGGGVQFEVSCQPGSEAFLSERGPFCALVAELAEKVTGRAPVIGTAGGTSDARFVHSHCPVVELGLKNAGAHAIDESVPIADLRSLTEIYRRLIDSYHSSSGASSG